MFEGDTNMPMADAIEQATGISIFAPPENLEEARTKLDAGLGAKLMREWRAKENEEMSLEFLNDHKYAVLVLGAYMMHVGAKIDDSDREHMKAILPKVPNSKGYVWPLGDQGFRDPGKHQMTAALEYYTNGKRRDFFQPRYVNSNPALPFNTNLVNSCYNCGKVSSDIGGVHLKKCTKCIKHNKTSYFCNQECQKENWQEHKEHICCPRVMGMRHVRDETHYGLVMAMVV